MGFTNPAAGVIATRPATAPEIPPSTLGLPLRIHSAPAQPIAAAAEAKLQLGSASVDNQMQDIEREAMDMQLQDKLLAYKQEMGLLPAATSGGSQQALPAQGETGAGEQSEKVVNNSNRIN